MTSRCTMSAAWAASSASAASRSQRSAICARHGLATVLRRAQPVGDGAAAEVLHDDVRVVGVLAGVVDRRDVRVLGDARGGARLALEAGAGAGSAAKWEPSTFTATTRPSRRSSTSQTVAIPPLAMWRVTR